MRSGRYAGQVRRFAFVLVSVLGCQRLAAQETERADASTTSKASEAPAVVASSAPSISASVSAIAPIASTSSKPNGGVGRCRPQEAQAFLIRKAYVPIETHVEEHRKALEYRSRNYGFVQGFGDPRWNAHPPTSYLEIAKFHGLRFRVNKKVIPALKCAEEEIARSCPEKYEFWDMSGIRTQNTYCCGEISNHMYGIAVDIDPSRNSCCNCAKPWSENPICKKKTNSIWERMVMPECWVKAFEKYGWHWLGREDIEDTMHFEFLGDPEKILED